MLLFRHCSNPLFSWILPMFKKIQSLFKKAALAVTVAVATFIATQPAFAQAPEPAPDTSSAVTLTVSPADQAQTRIESYALEAMGKANALQLGKKKGAPREKVVVPHADGGRTEIAFLKEGRAPIDKILTEQHLLRWDLKYARRAIQKILGAVQDMKEGHPFAFVYNAKNDLTHIFFRGAGWNGNQLYCAYTRDGGDEGPAVTKTMEAPQIKVEPPKADKPEIVIAPKKSEKKIKGRTWETRETVQATTAARTLSEVELMHPGQGLEQAGAPKDVLEQLRKILKGRVDLDKLPLGTQMTSLLEERLFDNGERMEGPEGRKREIVHVILKTGGKTYYVQRVEDRATHTVDYVNEDGVSYKNSLNTPKGTITSGYGPRAHGFHRGVDFAAAKGSPILAAGAGKVIYAGVMNGYGNVMIVDHGQGRETLYAHLEGFNAKVGAFVSEDSIIAYMGKSGRVRSVTGGDGTHLHLEVHENGQTVDPLTVCGKPRHYEGTALAAIKQESATNLRQIAELRQKGQATEARVAEVAKDRKTALLSLFKGYHDDLVQPQKRDMVQSVFTQAQKDATVQLAAAQGAEPTIYVALPRADQARWGAAKRAGHRVSSAKKHAR